jgi:hypothetical protein
LIHVSVAVPPIPLIETFVILLILPLASSVITGTIVLLPYMPAVVEMDVTSVFALSNAALVLFKTS